VSPSQAIDHVVLVCASFTFHSASQPQDITTSQPQVLEYYSTMRVLSVLAFAVLAITTTVNAEISDKAPLDTALNQTGSGDSDLQDGGYIGYDALKHDRPQPRPGQPQQVLPPSNPGWNPRP
jgi:hypothetical protein